MKLSGLSGGKAYEGHSLQLGQMKPWYGGGNACGLFRKDLTEAWTRVQRGRGAGKVG